MPAAQDKIVYLYFICNCIVQSVAYVLMFSCSMVRGRIKCRRQCYKSVVYRFTNQLYTGLQMIVAWLRTTFRPQSLATN